MFLFILLAIASISNKIIADQKELLDKTKENIASLKLQNEQLNQETDILNKKIQMGIGPPPCDLGKGNQVLLEIDFMRDTTFLVKVVNIDEDLILNNKWHLKRDSIYILKKYEFKELGYLLHESKKIHESDPDCDQRLSRKAWSSSYCYECVYVFRLVNFKDQLITKKLFPWFRKIDIGSEMTKEMIMIAQTYFYSTK